MIVLTQKVQQFESTFTQMSLSLTAQERTRTRRVYQSDTGEKLYLQLPRGTVLQDRDILTTEDQKIFLEVIAKPEPIVRIKASAQLTLMRAIYHLANRHVPLEITLDYLAIESDPVLEHLLKQMGLELEYQEVPFFPEQGAYPQH